jgi:hypothetical protein
VERLRGRLPRAAHVASLTAVAGVDTPADFSEYWLAVAWGESEDYDADGPGAIIH